MQPLNLKGRYTLVTGASAGLGREMARYLAQRHDSNLVLVARRKDRLEELAREVEGHGVKAVCIAADLTRPEDVERIFTEATDGREIHGAILNAGVTYFGHHLELSQEQANDILATNVLSVTRLSQQLLKHQLAKAPGGGVMVVSSMAGAVPTPYQALYSGTKSFINTWGVALGEELKGRDVSLTVFCPGGIATEMGEKSGTARKYKKGDFGVMDADVCARIAVDGFIARKRFVVPGLIYKLGDVVMRFAPRTVLAAFQAQVFKSALLPSGQKQPTQ
jgi:uncharacterized protein